MQRVPFPGILGPTYTLESLNAECQRCVNMFLETIETGAGKEATWLRPTPGLSLFCDLGTGPVRRLHTASNGRVFGISDGNLYEIDITGTKTLRGTLASTTGHLRMVDNGLVLFITAGSTSYRFKFSNNTLTQLADANYLGGDFVEFLDQYLLVNRAGTQQFQISPLAYDGSTGFAAGDVFSAESLPDYLTRHVVNGREVWLFGPGSYEVWWNTGDGTRPFQRVRDAAYNVGTVAPYSVESFQGRVFWLGGSKEGHGVVWASRGYQPERISNYGIEQIIASFDTIDDAESWTYHHAGHSVYVLTFPSASRTLCYDIGEQQWFELEYRHPTTNVRTRHRGSCHTFAFGKNLVGDYDSGKVYEFAKGYLTDNGDPIIRYRRSPHVQQKRVKQFYNYFELDAAVGIGLVSGQGSDPLVSLRFSDDGARTWSSYYTARLGAIGEYLTRVRWPQLGASYARVFELSVSDPVEFSLSGAFLGVTAGSN